jgi:CheY-like chemotaxis protein
LRYESGPGSELFLTVKDSGRGIALSERDKLFKPFSQADASMTRRYGGTGLGLNFSRELSRLLGGDLDLSWSQLGVGSEFTFHFPVVVPSDSAMIQQFLDPVRSLRETPPSLPPFDFSNIHILVVDDAPENRDIIGRYLAPTGARVDEASDGIQCIQMVETHHYDLILMDIQMPGLDGLQATSILRQKLFASPIIAITAHAMKEDRVRCIEAGCTDHLAKPLKKQDLMQMIELHRPTSITKAFRPNEVTF